MASFWEKTLYYLGLVDEEQREASVPPADEGVPQPTQAQVRTVGPSTPTGSGRGGVPGRRVEPPSRTRRRMSDDSRLAEAGVYIAEPDASRVRRVDLDQPGEAEVIEARAFGDAQRVADLLRDRLPAVLDLRATEPEMVRRLVDFASGLTYALDGNMRKIAQGVILVSPPRVTIGRDEKRRLAELGLYSVGDVE